MKTITTKEVYVIAAEELLRRANVEDGAGRTKTRDKLMAQYLELTSVIGEMVRPTELQMAD